MRLSTENPAENPDEKLFSDEEVMAFADGDAALPAGRAAALRLALAHDEALAARLARFDATRRVLKTQLSQASAAPLSPALQRLLAVPVPTPAALSPTALAGRRATSQRARRRRQWSAAAAASLLLTFGLLAGRGLLPATRDGLSTTLETAASGDSHRDGATEWLALSSMVDATGRYCREFERSDTAGSQRGVACRGGDGRWQPETLPAVPPPSDGGYQQASGEAVDAAAALKARRLTPTEEQQQLAQRWSH